MKSILKKVLHNLPFKRGLFSVVKIFNPSHNVYQHLYFKGQFRVSRTEETQSFRMIHHGYEIENELFWKGIKGYEPVSTNLWAKLSKDAKIIFDVGANTGVFSLLAGAANNNAQIYAFEPVGRVFKKLKDNIAINEFNIRAFDLAVSNKSGMVSFYDNSEEHNYSASLNPNHRPHFQEKLITAITLDEFCKTNGLVVDLIKIDVERHEPEAIEGFINHIREHQPTILIELLDQDIAERVETLLSGIPYRYFSISENEGVRQVERIGKSDNYNFLICRDEVAKKAHLWHIGKPLI